MAEDDLSWWDQIRGTLSGLMPAEKKYPPAFQAEHWEPTLKKAGYAPDSPEALLLGSIGKHINAQPMPSEPSTGQKIGGGLFSAAGAGLARMAGASVEGALQPTQQMLARAEDRSIRGENARTGGWDATGKLVIPQVAGAVTAAQQLQRQQQLQDALREETGLKPIYGKRSIYNPGKTAPGGPGVASPAPATRQPGPAEPAPAASPGPAAASPGATPPSGPAGPAGGIQEAPGADGKRYQVGKFRFYDGEVAKSFLAQINALSAGTSQTPTVTRDEKGNTVTQAPKTFDSILDTHRKSDQEAYHASPGYIGTKAATEKNVERSFAGLKSAEAEAEAATRANSDLGVLDHALDNLEQSGNRTGPGQDWLVTFQNWINSTPGMKDTFDPTKIANMEAIRKSSISTATEMAKAISTRGATQFEFKTIQNAVTGASLSMEGNRRLSAFIRATNNVKVQEAQLAAQLMQANGGQLPYDYEQQRMKLVRESDAKVAPLLNEIIQKYGGTPTAGAAKDGAGAAPALSREEAIKQAQELQRQNPALSKDEALKQALGAAKSAQPAAPAAQPETPAQPGQPAAPATKIIGSGGVFDTKTGGWNPDPGSLGDMIKQKWMARKPAPATAQPRPAPTSAYPGWRREDEEAIRGLSIPQGTP